MVFGAIGPDNPLAATIFAFLTAATNIPVTYLTFIDGHAYAVGGIVGALCTDAASGILTFTAAAILLAKFDSRAARAREESIAPLVEESESTGVRPKNPPELQRERTTMSRRVRIESQPLPVCRLSVRNSAAGNGPRF
jgi:hypothetical protein